MLPDDHAGDCAPYAGDAFKWRTAGRIMPEISVAGKVVVANNDRLMDPPLNAIDRAFQRDGAFIRASASRATESIDDVGAACLIANCEILPIPLNPAWKSNALVCNETLERTVTFR